MEYQKIIYPKDYTQKMGNTLMASEKTSQLQATDLTYMGLCTALIAICSWISIPASVPFTLQTFAIFTTLGLLGGRRGTIAVTAYVLLGAVGLPVFSGFKGGPGALLGATGGYIIGFILSALVIWAITSRFGNRINVLGLSMVLGLLICYAFGSAWYMLVYLKTGGAVGLLTVLGWCVFPFILPDLCKIALALTLTRQLRRFIKQ